jgi:hypothetical protein
MTKEGMARIAVSMIGTVLSDLLDALVKHVEFICKALLVTEVSSPSSFCTDDSTDILGS